MLRHAQTVLTSGLITQRGWTVQTFTLDRGFEGIFSVTVGALPGRSRQENQFVSATPEVLARHTLFPTPTQEAREKPD